MTYRLNSAPFLVVLVWASGCLGNGLRLSPAEAAAPSPYAVVRAATPVFIDGRIDEEAWKAAGALPFMTYETLQDPLSPTRGMLLWDDEYLYVAFEADDKDVWSYLDERDTWTFLEDCLEIFFKTDPERAPFHQFEINALGTVLDAFSPRPQFAGDIRRWIRWDCAGLKVAVTVQGSLNDPDDLDSGWTMEVAIPFRSLPSLDGTRPTPGDVWKFLLARYDYSVHLPGEGLEISSCAPMTRAFKHAEEWLTMVFVEGSFSAPR